MSHPLLNAFWMIFWFFLWIMWFMLLFRVIADVFSDKSMGGVAKVAWLVFVCVVPFVGVFVYLLARGHAMSERAEAQAQENKHAFDDYIRSTAGASRGSQADELAKLADLKANGTLSDAEFEQAKQKILA